MFKTVNAAVAGRRALIVEGDCELAQQMADDLRRSGGQVVATLPSVDAAFRFVQGNTPPDCIILDVRHADALERPLSNVFADFGIAVVFVTGFDDWYSDNEEEWEYAPAAYAHG